MPRRSLCLVSNPLGEEITVYKARLLRVAALQGTNRVAFELMFVPNLHASDLDHLTLELAAGAGSVSFFNMLRCIHLLPSLVVSFDTLIDACMSSNSLDIIKSLSAQYPINKSMCDGSLMAKALLFGNLGAVQYLLDSVSLVASHRYSNRSFQPRLTDEGLQSWLT